MNILAVDFGTKRVGLAWADTTLGVVLPYGLIEQEKMDKKVKELGELLAKERIDQVIVGFPFSLKGGENKNTDRIKQFVFELQKVTKLPIEYVDERFSSYGGDAAGAGVSRDERSAMFILEGYLASLKRKNSKA